VALMPTSQSLSARDRAASANGRISCSERRCSNPARIESAVIDCNHSRRVGFLRSSAWCCEKSVHLHDRRHRH